MYLNEEDVRLEGKIEKRPSFCSLGIDEDGMKDLLGLFIAQNEGAKFWLSILTKPRSGKRPDRL